MSAPFENAVAAVAAALKKAGVQHGATMLVQSDTQCLNTLLPGIDWPAPLEVLLKGISTALGPEGTLLVPTFTFSFCRGRAYRHEGSASQVGLFSNYVLKRPDAIRSFHPIYSFAGIGPRAAALLADPPSDSFGPGSVFDRLYEADATQVFFGVGFEYCTFLHYVEQAVGVSYRYLKTFAGMAERDGRTFETKAQFYVRDEKLLFEKAHENIIPALSAAGALRKAVIGSGELSAISSRDIFRLVSSRLAENPFVLLAAPPTSA